MEEALLPNLKLLALLDKLVHPIGSCRISYEAQGIFALPEEWKVPDGQNPAESIFSYKVSFQGAEVTEGQFLPRMLTEEEKKAIEEAAAAKQKKKAPADKKSKQEEVPQISPEELERQRKLEEEKAEAQRKAKEEWDKLDEQTKFYRTYEDQFKHPCLKFEKNNQASTTKEGEDLVLFEENVELGGDWIFVTRFPNLPEDKIAALRKQKPKGLNILDLNPCLMKAWVDMSEFQTPGQQTIIKRCKLQQFYLPDQKPEEQPKANLADTYILVKITLDPPITPLITEIQPKASDLIPKPQPIPKMPASIEVINEFKGQLVVAMESLAMEYSQMFAKEMNSSNEPKGKLLSQQQKREQREQRKEKFLYDFNMSGKYNILKEKMKKSIMKIVRDKFQKEGSLTGVTTDTRDQFYSQLYMFLVEQMRTTLNDLIFSKKDELHEDLVVSLEQSNKERDKVIYTITKESESDKALRLATENEIINNLIESEKAFKNLLNIDKTNSKNWYAYCLYLLRRKNFPKAEEALQEALRYDPENTDYILLMACLLARRDRKKEPVVFLNHILDKNFSDSLANSLMSFVYSKVLNEPKLGKKYFAVCQRIMMRKLNLIPNRASQKSMMEDGAEPFNHRSMQQIVDDNRDKKINLSLDQIDEIWIELVEYLLKFELHDLAEKVMANINDKHSNKTKYFQAQIEYMKGDVDKAVNILDEMIKANPKSTEYLLAKANYCFVADKFYEAEETFLTAFKLKANVKTFATYLRLGYIFLARKSWGDARAVLAKACEMKPSSSISWLGLGIACFRTQEYKEGEQSLTQANIYDPLNGEVWGYLALLALHDGARMVQAHQSLREMLKCELKNNDLLEEIADKLTSINKTELAETLYKKLLDNWQTNNTGLQNNVGIVYSKLAKIYHTEERLLEARLYYTEALKFLEGEAEKERIEIILNDIRNAIESGANNN